MPFHLSLSPSSPSPSPSHPPASPPRLSQSIYSTSKSYSVINPSSIDPLNCLNNNDNDDIPITSPHIIDSLSYPIEQLEYNSILQSATSSISLPPSSHTPPVRLSAIQISSNPPFSGPDSRRSDIFPVKKYFPCVYVILT